jgi:hypothetical protein
VDVYIPPDVEAVVRDVQPRNLVLVFDVTTTKRLPVASAVRVATDAGAKTSWERLTRIVPDSVTVTGPRRLVNAMGSVSTIEQTVTVRDGGDFLVPIDMKRVAAGVHVKPAEVRVLIGAAPVTGAATDSSRLTALRPRP